MHFLRLLKIRHTSSLIHKIESILLNGFGGIGVFSLVSNDYPLNDFLQEEMAILYLIS